MLKKAWLYLKIPPTPARDNFSAGNVQILYANASLVVIKGTEIKRESGSLRVHHLANAGTVLNVLRDNHTKFVNINSVDLVDGNPKITLALVWTIISRWNKYVYNRRLR